MFKYNRLTDYEKLIIANSYIKELKKQLRRQEQNVKIINDNKLKFIKDFKTYSSRFSRLVSYRQEMIGAHKKNKMLQAENNKLLEKIFKLNQEK